GARRAAEAAACAGEQGAYWPMHAQLFAHQDSLGDPSLRQMATGLGLDIPRFMQCLNSSRYEGAWKQSRQEASAAGITATPTFFVNGDMYTGLASRDELSQLVEEHRPR